MTDVTEIELVGTIVAALLTVVVLSYLIGDNALFRVATHMFTGIAAGYAGSIAWHNVLKPSMVDPLIAGGLPGILDGSIFSGSQGRLMIGAWILVLLMLFKLSPSTSRLGTLPLVIMVGVGVGVVVGGAITGTLIPQSTAAVASLNPGSFPPESTGNFFVRLFDWLEPIVEALIVLAGTICTLLFFQFTARKSPTGIGERPAIVAVAAKIGKAFIAITFGVMYAGAIASTLIVLSERMDSLVNLIRDLLSAL